MKHVDATFSTRPATHFSAIYWIALVLLIVGGLNWGLVGIAGIDLVATLLGPMSVMSRIVYILVAAAALYAIYFATRQGAQR